MTSRSGSSSCSTSSTRCATLGKTNVGGNPETLATLWTEN